MKLKQVIKKYQKKVPFPITRKKIRAAGYNPTVYTKKLWRELYECDDWNGQPLYL